MNIELFMPENARIYDIDFRLASNAFALVQGNVLQNTLLYLNDYILYFIFITIYIFKKGI